MLAPKRSEDLVAAEVPLKEGIPQAGATGSVPWPAHADR